MAPISLKRYAVLASLCAATALSSLSAHAQQATVQDGIKVRPCRLRASLPAAPTSMNNRSSNTRSLVNEAKRKKCAGARQRSASETPARHRPAHHPVRHALESRRRPTGTGRSTCSIPTRSMPFACRAGASLFTAASSTKLNLTDDEVAIVMGHEIAHALREHARRRPARATWPPSAPSWPAPACRPGSASIRASPVPPRIWRRRA